ncbi:MAG: hypothetical protein HRT71_14175 [Flavobacteriales bacterium]|nr:hypothetical protein [Flavobacteriales bacterium]
MKEIFLNAKHWQICTIICGTAIINNFVFFSFFDFLTRAIIAYLADAFVWLVFIGWAWNVVLGLQGITNEVFRKVLSAPSRIRRLSLESTLLGLISNRNLVSSTQY